MSSPVRARQLLRRFVLAIAAATVVVMVPVVATSAQAHEGHDKIGGKIKRSEVIERARTWVKRDIQYSQGGTAKDAERHHRYRRDCSGYIAMVWHLKATGMSAPWTGTLGNYSVAKRKSHLKRGDILLDAGSHVVLFHKWANRAHTRFWLFEMSNPSSDMNHRVAYLSSYGGYQARRFKHIVNG